MSTVALILTVKKWKQPKSLSHGEWGSKLGSIHPEEYHSAANRNKTRSRATAGATLENRVLRGRRQTHEAQAPHSRFCVHWIPEQTRLRRRDQLSVEARGGVDGERQLRGAGLLSGVMETFQNGLWALAAPVCEYTENGLTVTLHG